jgi:uncharacterized protein involved in exopolysaccharide biosynthesis
MNCMKLRPKMLLDIWRRRHMVILAPAGALTLAALVVAVLSPKYWSATQALYIRDEGGGIADHQGRFVSVDAMQTAQETILEVARHHNVLKAALLDCGPDQKLSQKKLKNWPDGDTIDGFRSLVSVRAPKGAQFGRTELIYLTAKARNTDRAVRLTDALTKRLILRMQELRQEKYGELVKELEEAARIAEQDLTRATRRLQELERSVGVDLAELRVLMNEGQGDGHLRRTASEITRELRIAEAKLVAKRKELEQLTAARHDDRALIALPSQILDSQPLLKRMKEGLVEAQIRVSQTLGDLNPEHPRAKAVIHAEKKIRAQVYRELQTALAAVRNEVDVIEGQIRMINARGGETTVRLENLADLRAQYGTLVADVKQRTAVLEAAQTDLASAQGNLLAARASSLIQRVESPVPSSNPVGPGRSTIVLAGMLAGLAIGVGVVFLLEPEEQTKGDPWNDLLNSGRRTTDRIRSTVPTQPLGIERRGSATAGGRRQWDRGIPPVANPAKYEPNSMNQN